MEANLVQHIWVGTMYSSTFLFVLFLHSNPLPRMGELFRHVQHTAIIEPFEQVDLRVVRFIVSTGAFQLPSIFLEVTEYTWTRDDIRCSGKFGLKNVEKNGAEPEVRSRVVHEGALSLPLLRAVSSLWIVEDERREGFIWREVAQRVDIPSHSPLEHDVSTSFPEAEDAYSLDRKLSYMQRL